MIGARREDLVGSIVWELFQRPKVPPSTKATIAP